MQFFFHQVHYNYSMQNKLPLPLRFTVFFLLLGVFFLLIQPLYLPLGEVSRWRNFFAQPADSVDVVFVGTSHTYHSFNPEVIDNLLPIRSHTVGIPGDNIQIVYHEIRSILRDQQPEVIFVDAFSLAMTNWLNGPYVYRFLNASFSPAHLVSSADILFSNRYEWANYFPMIRYRGDRSDFVQLWKNPTDATAPEYPENPQGHAPLTNVISAEDYANIPFEGYLHPLPDHYIDYLQKVIDLSRSENFTLAFTDTPWKGFENPFYDLYERDEEFKLISREAIPYYDFRTYPLAYNWTQLHFYDRDHPSEFGSLIISVRMAELLSETMHLPLDADQLAWYQNFYFDSFTLAQGTDQVTLTLVPAHPEAALAYRWQVLAWDEITPLSEEIQTDAPTVSFENLPSGQYRIAVAITQSGGEYELEGRFAWIIPAE